ncbi:MAG: hypothetical protein BLM47_09050 [Candidatus Reconcilbacillus cellulovorans]|uniref:CAAX protease family protein n=1 Tax=Candidatus Reconcilbacillus cellulovorans TaxID=1906605 RepID=A0A2A6DYB5_9BACL|nr:MAG: hypothetical protein BLM47_09050 [Candidatus Reconcilbacillus cellulovorans]
MKRIVFSLPFWGTVGALLFVVVYFIPASPLAETPLPGIEKAISRQEAVRAALEFVAAREPGFSEKSASVEIAHETAEHLAGYLAKNGLEREYAERYAESRPVEFYKVDVRAPGVRYYVYVNLFRPEVIGWRKQSAGTVSGTPDVGAIAARFLKNIGVDPDRLERVDLPDGTIRFVDPAAAVGEARLAYRIFVQGGEVTGYRTGFEPPESHVAWQTRQKIYAAVVSILYLLLFVAVVIAAWSVALADRKHARFSSGAVWTLLFAVLFIVLDRNGRPASLAAAGEEFRTATNDAFIFVSAIGFAVVSVAGLYGCFVAGERLCRRLGWNVWPQTKSEDFGRQIVRHLKDGYSLALFMLGLQALLLWIAWTRFGAWGINDPNTSILNQIWPEWFPLTGWMAAIQEEAVFRLFGIPACFYVLRNRLAAVLATSLLWSLGHVTYPVYPVYTRIWEVTALGVVLGLVFLRRGWLTVLFAHAIFNLVMISLMLMAVKQNAAGVAIALAYVASPAAIALVMTAWHRLLRKRTPAAPAPAADG